MEPPRAHGHWLWISRASLVSPEIFPVSNRGEFFFGFMDWTDVSGMTSLSQDWGCLLGNYLELPSA